MSYTVDFNSVSTVGLESSPVAAALAGLRANEARYFKNKYDHTFTVEPAGDAKTAVDWVHDILQKERDLVIASPPLEATAFEVDGIRMAYVFYESGLSINVMYPIADGGKRAVGVKLSDGVEGKGAVGSKPPGGRGGPEELPSFKFPRQRSKLAGTIRGSYFVIKNEYCRPRLRRVVLSKVGSRGSCPVYSRRGGPRWFGWRGSWGATIGRLPVPAVSAQRL